MAPKKKGPFYFLMKEVQHRRREQNLPCALEDVREEAAEIWTNLTEDGRAVYEAMANNYKEGGRGSLHNKFTSDGRIIELVIKEEHEVVQQHRDMISSIQQYVDDMGSLESIKEWPLFIMSTNILCDANGVQIPLEIAFIEYSIKQGITRAFHRFINPGRIPLGFASAAKDHSEDKHGIPISGFEDGITDYKKFVDDLLAFLRFHVSKEDPCPPVFTAPDHIAQAAGCLNWMEEAAGMQLDIQVWDILPLLRKLRSVSGEELSQAEAEGVLLCALFDYDMKSLCYYHAQIDNRYCALGECRRIGYKLSNALLTSYHVENVIEYQHMPPRFDPSLTFEVSQMNVKPVRSGAGRRMQQQPQHTGAGDEDGYARARENYAPPPLPRESRRPDDYYGEETGPIVVAAGTRVEDTSTSSGFALDEDFPSLCEAMQNVQPPSRGASGGGAKSSTAAQSGRNKTSTMTSEASQQAYGGARPKTGHSSRLAAQFPERASAANGGDEPVAQGIGRGLVADPLRERLAFPKPRASVYIQLRKPGSDTSSGAGRGAI